MLKNCSKELTDLQLEMNSPEQRSSNAAMPSWLAWLCDGHSKPSLFWGADCDKTSGSFVS